MSNKRLNVFKRLGSATDARQLLTRSNSNEKVVVVTGIKDAKVQHGKIVPRIDKTKEVVARGSSTLVTIRNPSTSTEKISLTKTIENPSAQRETQKNVVVRIVNDKFEKPPPVVKRSTDASIQTNSPIQAKTKKRTIDDDNDDDEDIVSPAPKRSTTTTVRRTTKEQIETSSSTATARSTTKSKTTDVSPGSATILVTNLQASVTEEDVMELFSEIGRINEIKTLSQGCVQIIFAKRDDAEQAVTKYHNRLLDGQSMYVSLQQSSPSPLNKSNTTSSSQTTTTTTSNKITIDPDFFRQALFNPSNNTANPVQFQVKL